MANGDPMILRTRWSRILAPTSSYDSFLLNAVLENWANTAAAADNWTWVNSNTETPTLSRFAEARTSGNGSYVQRIQYVTPATGLLGEYYQRYTLKGDAKRSAYGHLGQTIKAAIWIKRLTSDFTLKLKIEERDASGSLITSSSNDSTIASATWAYKTHSHVISDAACAQIGFVLRFETAISDAHDIRFDDAELYQEYTFAVNPSVPDRQSENVAHRSFGRAVGGRMILSRPAANLTKIQKVLRVRMVGINQVNALRSLWYHDVPMEWAPSHPHLPATVDVRWVNDFNFTSLGPFNANLFEGTMDLQEY